MAHKVLIVDDEEVFSSLICRQLTHRGFSVTTVSDGEEALQNAKTQHPDVILLDILLPGINGVEILKRLKDDPQTQDIPVIICSVTFNEKVKITSLLDLGANDYVHKPCEPDTLVARLHRVIGSA